MISHRFKGPEIELFLNGDPPSYFKKKYFSNQKIYAVDGAFSYLRKKKIPIHYLSGDFDSISKKDFPLEKTIIFHTYNQNYTDFDKALKILYKKKIFNINVWGASGKEQDHFLGNLSTALKYKKKLSIIFHDHDYFYFFSEKKKIFFPKKNKKISLYPFPKVIGLKTSGLQYPIKNKSLEIGKNIGIRNQSKKEKVKILYKNGELLIFVEK